jgi:hypothetical protein
VEIGEIAHGEGEVVGGAALGDLDVAPGAMGVESDEEIGGAVASDRRTFGSTMTKPKVPHSRGFCALAVIAWLFRFDVSAEAR